MNNRLQGIEQQSQQVKDNLGGGQPVFQAELGLIPDLKGTHLDSFSKEQFKQSIVEDYVNPNLK